MDTDLRCGTGGKRGIGAFLNNIKCEHDAEYYLQIAAERAEENRRNEECAVVADQWELLNQRILEIESKITEIDVIIGENEDPLKAIMARGTSEALARMVYQETKYYENGEQSEVLWVVVNRIFTDANFTRNEEQTIYNILFYGRFEALERNNDAPYNAFHPDYESGGWKNAKRLAASLYAIVGEQGKKDLDEQEIRETLAELTDTMGNKITNTIGDNASFWGGWQKQSFLQVLKGKYEKDKNCAGTDSSLFRDGRMP